MKVFLKNTIIKKILIVFITIIMVSNFIMPNYVCAATAGEKLVSGFFYLIAYVGDIGIKLLQEVMLGTSNIKEGDSYSIKYSPGVIFANEVPALDINFISPSTKTIDSVTYNKTGTTVGNASTVNDLYNNYGQILLAKVTGNSQTNSDDAIAKVDALTISEGTEQTAGQISINIDSNTYTIKSYYEKKQVNRAVYTGNGKGVVTVYYYYAKLYDPQGTLIGNFARDSMEQATAKNSVKTALKSKVAQLSTSQTVDSAELEKIKNLTYSITKVNNPVKIGNCYVSITRKTLDKGEYEYSYAIYEPTVTDSKTSTASVLRDSIATWYLALRTIALVGLLSVLVYLGIRIILSSASAQDKAKYKNMLKDWLVAVCILFVLHYMMAFMLNVTGQLGNIIKNNVISGQVNFDGTQEDKLITEVREKIGDSYDDAHVGDTAGYTIMYLALVILTGIFTVQYLKRVIFMAFLTMVAPMIALTYPLDKIKDGKAQAFSYWLREYIFNCLIQPVHLLLYTITIINALDFAVNNVLYGIVALAFMVPAEKFIKEMFGMKSSSPTGTLGAAAGGAMVMSMINKLKSKPPKEEEEKTPSVRTANRAGTTTGGTTPPGGGTTPPGGETTLPGGGTTPPGGGTTPPGGGTTPPGGGTTSPGGGTTSPGGGTSSSYSIGNGFKALGNKYIYGPDAIKSHGKKFRRAAGGALLGAAAGTIGLAAQVADGDLFDNPEKALGQTLGAAAVGYAAGANFVDSTWQNGKNASETFKEGAYGKEQYNNMKFDKKFFKSDDYKLITEDPSINQTNIKQRTQEFLNNGITDAKQIRTALQNGITGNEFNEYNKASVNDAKQMKALKDAGITPQGYEAYSTEGITNISKIIDIKNKHPRMSDASRANWMKLAKNAPKNLNDFKTQMVGRRFNGVLVTDTLAETIYRQLVDFF